MAHPMTTSVAHHLGALFEGGSTAGLSDRQLIERFVNGRESLAAEAAFSALVARHGPMVLGICQQLLGDRHHAEDAFQAVFFVLARRARSVRDPDLLSHWLYGVALRTARKARTRLGRLRRREGNPAANRPEACPDAPADQAVLEGERAEFLHEEIDRLPTSSRLPVVLCYFEGLSLAEAAHRLRCPAGTVHSRLVRAREKLRSGLIRRGVVLSTTAMAAAMAPRSASASIPPLLCDSTTRAAIAFAAHHAAAGGALAAPATALAQEVLRTMLLHKLRLAAMTVLVLAAVATGTGWLARSLAMKEGPANRPTAQAAPRGADRPAPTPRSDPAAPARMTVAGRVLDPDGKPIPNADVDVVSQPRAPVTVASLDLYPHALLGQGRSGADGRFRFDADRTASTRVYEVYAIARAPGYGLGGVELNPDADRPSADVRLRPERPIRVRLVDVTGAPAKGAEVRVKGSVIWSTNPPEVLHAWPRPVKTDDQGKATVSGIGRGDGVMLTVPDMRFARQDLLIAETDADAGKEITLALQPARIIEGRVLAADTGQPIPGAVIAIAASQDQDGGMYNTRFRADDRGRFTANPSPGAYFRVNAFAPPGQPYLVPKVEFAWTKGAVRKELDIKVPRGTLIRGTVTEAGTNRPLAGSSIQFIPVRARGGRGALGLAGDRRQPRRRLIRHRRPARQGLPARLRPDPRLRPRFHRLEQDLQRSPRRVALLRPRDPPLRGRGGRAAPRGRRRPAPRRHDQGPRRGPDGQAVADAVIISNLHVEAPGTHWHSIPGSEVRDGRFELHGVAPEGSARIAILDPAHEWGATAEVSGKPTGEEPTIRLQPCGKAKARFVGPDAKPVARHQPIFEFVATPGPSQFSLDERDRAELLADADYVANTDREHYLRPPSADAEGRIVLPDLVPGATYRIIDFSAFNDPKGGKVVARDFTVQPGETLDLGDIVVAKPAG